MMRAGRSGRIGIVVGADSITAVIGSGFSARVESVPLAPVSEDAAAALAESFEQLAARLRAATGRDVAGLHATLVLLPPHADVRLIALPPLRRAEAELVLRRDAARHFVGGTGAKVVAVRMPRSPGRRSADHAPVLAAAASAQFAEAIRVAAQRVGWNVQRLTPAHAAWVAAAEQNARRSTAGAPIGLIAIAGDTAHVVRLERGAVTHLRRVPVADRHDIPVALGHGPGSASVFADGPIADAIAQALTTNGWTVVRGADATQVAGATSHDATLELLPASVLAEHEQRRRSLAGQLVGAAVVLLLATAGVQVWGAQRELDTVRARRAELRPQVAPLLETRDSLDRLRQRADELRALTSAPRWTRALFDIALLLPDDAHLVSLRGTGDTLRIEAEGARAGAALQALRSASSLRNVSLQGPIERDLEAGATTLERFALQARVVTTDTTTTERRP